MTVDQSRKVLLVGRLSVEHVRSSLRYLASKIRDC